MSLEQDIRLLRNLPLFSGFSDDQLRLLAFGAEQREYPSGSVLFEAGDRADSALVVTAGQIEIRDADDARLLTTATIGAMIGETALLTETSRPNRAVTAAVTAVIRIRRTHFRRILSEFPEAAAQLHAGLSKQLDGTLSGLKRIQDALSKPEDDASDDQTP